MSNSFNTSDKGKNCCSSNCSLPFGNLDSFIGESAAVPHAYVKQQLPSFHDSKKDNCGGNCVLQPGRLENCIGESPTISHASVQQQLSSLVTLFS